MGYSSRFVAVNLNSVRAVVGSRDAALLAAITTPEDAARSIQEANSWFGDYIEEGAPRLEQAVEQIVMGSDADADHGFMYWYAVELLCLHYGQVLVDDIDWTLLYGDDALPTTLIEAELPLDLPEPADWPSIGVLYLEDLPDEIARLRSLIKNCRYPGDEAIVTTMQKAADMARDLIVFTY